MKMKLVITILSTLLVGLVAASNEECFHAVMEACNRPFTGKQDDVYCNSMIGAINHAQSHLQIYTYHQLASSYDYILLSTVFSSYEKDRPGFAKVFRELSDKAFNNGIKLIKQVTRRGGVVDFQDLANVNRTKKALDLSELHALAYALDNEKRLSVQAIINHASVSTYTKYDPELSQFLEEEFLEDQIKTIRKLSGHVNDLQKIMFSADDDTSLGVYLFDEYLQKL